MSIQKTAWPIIDQKDVENIMQVVTSRTFVKGEFSKQLAEEFAQFIKVGYCRTVGSCTHAIHLALIAAGIGQGDEVLVPDLTYVGSVSPIVNAGAVPVFVDIDPADYNISIRDALKKRTSKTRVIIPVHVHGYPCNIHTIRESFPGLVIIEDACQAHGAKRAGIYAGSSGDIGCFSLNQVKPLCGGQGGLVVTNDRRLWERIEELASPGKGDTVGLSYEITEMSAALALSQLSKLTTVIEKANHNYMHFKETINPEWRGCLPVLEPDVVPTWHKLRFRPVGIELTVFTKALSEGGVPYDTWPHSLVSERSEYRKKYRAKAAVPHAEAAMRETIIIGNELYPFHAQDTNVLDEWVKVINEILDNYRRTK